MKDTTARSLSKAVSWRIVGTLDTFVLAMFYTGNLKMAFFIGSTEVFTKIGLYFFHERVWNNVKWGREGNIVTKYRSLTKSVSWRVVGTLDTMFISLFYSKDLKISVMIVGTETLTKFFLYYLHERIWTKVRWGRVV